MGVNLTISGSNNNKNPEMEGIDERDILLGLKWVIPHLVQIFKVGRHTADPDAEVGEQHVFGQNMTQEDKGC